MRLPLGDRLAVGLYVALLEVVREFVQVPVVRQERMGVSAVEVVVPDAKDREEDGASSSRAARS